MSNRRKDVCDQVEMYVLGGLTNEEQEEFEIHLKDCSHCQQQVKELQEVVDGLPLTSEPVEPPQGMKERVLGKILNETGYSSIDNRPNNTEQHESHSAPVPPVIPVKESNTQSTTSNKRGLRFWGIGATAASLILGIVSLQMFFENQDMAEQLQVSQAEIVEKETQLTQMETLLAQSETDLQQATAALEDPMQLEQVVQLSPLAEDMIADGLATIVIDARGTHLLVQAEDLPDLQGTEAFQVWLIKGEDAPVNAGTFLTENNRGALHYTFEPDDYDTIAITHEPDAEGDAPRGEMVLVAPIVEDL